MKKIFLILALLCTIVQGAWAQSSWDEVYAITQTNSANWTQLTEGSTTGKTLGTANATTYYYADTNLTFSNSNAGTCSPTAPCCLAILSRARPTHCRAA